MSKLFWSAYHQYLTHQVPFFFIYAPIPPVPLPSTCMTAALIPPIPVWAANAHILLAHTVPTSLQLQELNRYMEAAALQDYHLYFYYPNLM